MLMSVGTIIVISMPNPKTGLRKVEAVFSGAAENRAHSFYVRNIHRCPSVEFFGINRENNEFSPDEEKAIEEFLHRLEE